MTRSKAQYKTRINESPKTNSQIVDQLSATTKHMHKYLIPYIHPCQIREEKHDGKIVALSSSSLYIAFIKTISIEKRKMKREMENNKCKILTRNEN